jgi:hypothetical protein
LKDQVNMMKKVKGSRRRLSAARVVAFAAFALLALCLPGTASAQWTTPNTQGNINSTNTGNVGVGTTTPTFLLDVSGSTNTPFRVRDSGGREYFSTSSRSGPWGVTPITSISGGRLIVEHNGPDGGNETVIRRAVNSMIFNPSDHPDLPGAFAVRQKGGNFALFVDQSTNGKVGIGTTTPSFLLDVSGSTNTPFRVRDSGGREYFSTSSRSGPWGVTPIASISGGRLIVEGNGPDGGNETVIRRAVNSMIFKPSDHPDLPGALIVQQKSGNYALFVDQGVSGNVGIGTAPSAAKLNVGGDLNATGTITGGNISAKYQDVAEWVPSTQKLSAATVVRLDPQRSNQVLASTSAYDTSVAGVISAQPGIALGERGEGKVLVATTGRVKVRVDATRAPIKVGDLLVTSDVAGVAMRSEPVMVGGIAMHRPGTIVGKALEPLAGGTGEILVLLSLQ